VKLEGDKLDKFLAGKNVTVSGTVHSVKEKPAFTDALVKEKSSGTYNTIAELEDAVMDSVVVNLALENLVDKSKVKKNLPKSDVTKEYDALEASAKNMYAMVNQAACLTSEELASFVYQYGPYYLGVSPAGSTVQAMCNAFAAAAASTVKEKMVLYYVADAEGMKVTDKEYKAYLKEQASIQGVSSGEYEDAYGEDSIRETMLFTEVSDYLCELIKGQLSLTNKSDKK